MQESLAVELRTAATAPVLYYASEKGYFAKEGLDVSIKVGATTTTADLVAGNADIIGISLSAVLGIANQGKDARPIYVTDSGSNAYVVTATDSSITSPTRCKTMASSIPGTNVYAWSMKMQDLFDVKWELSQITDVPTFANRVVTGQSDCGMGAYSTYDTAIAAGKLRVIFDPSDEAARPAGWPSTTAENVFAGLEPNLQSNKTAVEKFIKGYDAGLQAFRDADSQEIAAVLLKSNDWAGSSQDALTRTVEAFKPKLSPNKGYLSADAWPPTLDFFKVGGAPYIDPAASQWSYRNRTNMSFYDAALGAP